MVLGQLQAEAKEAQAKQMIGKDALWEQKRARNRKQDGHVDAADKYEGRTAESTEEAEGLN